MKDTMHQIKVLVVGSSNGNSGSMDRYSGLLLRSYKNMGIKVQLACPTNLISRSLPQGNFRKYAKYVESLIVFPFYLNFMSIGKVVHFADHSDALLMPWTFFSSRKMVTCHDLIAVRAALGEIPEYRPKVLGTFYQKLVLRGLSKADSIAAVSEATAEDVARLVPKVNISTLLNPIDIELALPIKAVNLGFSYFLIVAHTSWRKARDASIKTWLKLRDIEEYRDSRLIVVGPPLAEEEISKLTDETIGSVEVRSEIADGELSKLYAGCIALIQMSKYEGFGWPVIEVNAQSRPAICSDIKVFHEIGEQNVFLSDKKSISQVCQELKAFEGKTVSSAVRHKFSDKNFQIQLRDLLLKTIKRL